MSEFKAARLIRYSILIGILVFVTFQLFMHASGNSQFASVHGICPFGGLETLFLYITEDGRTLGKIFSGTMGLFFVTLLMIILFRRGFCGLICPLGTLQEIFSFAGRKLFRKRLSILPEQIDRYARFLKYFILLLILIMTILTGTLWFQTFDPWTAYAHIFSFDEVLSVYLIGFTILIISLAMSLFIDRFFCKYACPMGAFTALTGFFMPLRIQRDKDVCTSCNLCSEECPGGIKVSQLETINSTECLNCGSCVHVCPVPGAIHEKFFTFKLNPIVTPLLAFFIFIGGLLVIQAFGFDRYSSGTEPTLREIAKQQGISAKALKQQYGLSPWFFSGTRVRDIEYSIPFYKVAQMSGQSPSAMKQTLELPEDIDENMKWGAAFDMVRLEVVAKLNKTTTDTYIQYFNLGDKVNANTPWKDIRKKVEKAIEKEKAANSHGCGSHTGGSCK